MSKTLVEMATELVQGQKFESIDEMQNALRDTFATLNQMAEGKVTESAGTVNPLDDELREYRRVPRRSIKRDFIVCLECGFKGRTLSHKHLKSHGMTHREYRKKYGLLLRQPLTAISVSEKRIESGKKRGIPQELVDHINDRSGTKKDVPIKSKTGGGIVRKPVKKPVNKAGTVVSTTTR